MSHYRPYPAYKSSEKPWLGELPEAWNQSSLKWIARRFAGGTPDKTIAAYWDDGTIPWLASGEVNQRLITTPSTYITEDAYRNSSAKWVPSGALVMALAGQGRTRGTVAQLAIESTCNQSMAAIVATGVVPRFLYWWLDSNYSNLRGLSGDDVRDGLNLEVLGNIPCPRPGDSEQRAIVKHLDRETTRIDALVSKKTRFIELLREKRQALITHAVTKGLDPNVKMKDSGVEWLGEVPENWVIARFCDACISISTGPFGTALGNDDYVTNGIPIINPSHIQNSECHPDPDISVSDEFSVKMRFWAMSEGDIVTARRGELGRAAIITGDQSGWICGTGSLRVRPQFQKATSKYLHAILQSHYAREWLNLSSVGATMANLNEGILGRLPVALPPSIEEQTRLIELLETQSKRLTDIEESAERSIELLKERRSALITAAVTGQIDLREAA